MNLSRALTVSLLATVAVPPSLLWAQVAPTEVHEQAVDEFGLDRKTGRFVWSSGPLVGIGPEGAHLNIVVTGLDNPPNAETVIKPGAYSVEVNGPRLSLSYIPKTFPQFAGDVDTDWLYATVDYQGGSHTFTCRIAAPMECTSHYFSGMELYPQTSSFLFIDRDGLRITFSTDASDGLIVTEYPDGRVVEMRPGRFRKNNQGFLLKEGDGTIHAINQVQEYCDLAVAAGCQSATELRYAQLPTAQQNPSVITDSAGGSTSLYWTQLTAKETIPPKGANEDVYGARIRDIGSRYLTGIQLPGSSSENITISWSPVDPRWDTHDDVRVSSISRGGVTINYDVDVDYAYGKYRQLEVESEPYEVDPSSPSSGAGVTLMGSTGWATRIPQDSEESPSDTQKYADWSNAQIGPSSPEPIMIDTQEAPPDGDNSAFASSLAGQIFDLTIVATMSNQTVSTSFSHKPWSLDGMSRRRLLFVEGYPDGIGPRKTHFLSNHLEEVAMVVYPEGDAIAEGFDHRGNVVSVTRVPKPDPTTGEPSGPILETLYTYEPDCPDAIRTRCNKPLTMTDPAGNVTEYTYNDRGQLLTETGPAPTPGAARPTTRHEYTERTAWILDGSGGLVPAGPPISLLTRTSQCLTTENCVGTTDEVVTEYDYGPIPAPGAEYATNLLLRGVAVTAADANGQMQTLRTCYSYNYFGEKVSETSPRADLQVCP